MPWTNDDFANIYAFIQEVQSLLKDPQERDKILEYSDLLLADAKLARESLTRIGDAVS